MADMVTSKYVKFYTNAYLASENDKEFDTDAFDAEYNSNSNRMTPLQIKMAGYDTLRSQLWSRFIDKKYDTLYHKKLATSTEIISQLENAIKKLFPETNYKVYQGEVKKYGDGRLRLTYMRIGDYDKEYIKIVPTLDDTDGNYFNVQFETEYMDTTRHFNDIELIDEIGKFNKYLATGEKPTTFIGKMYHKYDNQYRLEYGTRSMELYDVEMMQLYHTLAKETNRVFGTDFEFSQTMIDKLWKHEVFGNIQYVGRFYLEQHYYDKGYADLEQEYFYEDDGTKKPTFQCCATYGSYSKEDLIALLTALKPYATSNYFADTSMEKMGYKYDSYDKMHVGYKERPLYFQDLVYVK